MDVDETESVARTPAPRKGASHVIPDGAPALIRNLEIAMTACHIEIPGCIAPE